jgi:parallel beta-helix repeat protein
MAVFLSPVGGVAAQFFTNTGAVLTGGKLYTYAAGTTTPAATYTSAAGVTFNTNPIVLDAAGRVPSSGEIWLTDSAQYKFVLKDSNDVLIATWDNITGINSNFLNFNALEEVQTATAGQTVFTLANAYTPGTNTLSVFVDGVNQYDGSSYSYVETNSTTVTFTAGLHVGALVKFTTAVTLSAGVTSSDLVTYLPGGSGAVATTVQAKLRQTVSVMDFGATGDGTTDDTAAIQAAVNSLTAGVVVFPVGTYLISAKIILKSNVSMSGLGATITYTTPYADDTGMFDDNSSAVENITIEGFVFDGNGTWTNTPFANPYGGGNSVGFTNGQRGVALFNASSKKITINNNTFTGLEQGIYTGACEDILINGNIFDTIGTAAVNTSCTYSTISNNVIRSVLGNLTNAGVTNVDQSIYADGIYFYSAQTVSVTGNVIEDCVRIGVVLEGDAVTLCSNISISGNSLKNFNSCRGTEYNAAIWAESGKIDYTCSATGNVCDNTGAIAGTNASYGILGTRLTMTGNTITAFNIGITSNELKAFNNTIQNSSQSGIQLGSQSANKSSAIVGNHISNNGACGILIAQSRGEIHISGNMIIDNGQTTANPQNFSGIAIERYYNNQKVVISGNTFISSANEGATTGQLRSITGVAGGDFTRTTNWVRNNQFIFTGTFTTAYPSNLSVQPCSFGYDNTSGTIFKYTLMPVNGNMDSKMQQPSGDGDSAGYPYMVGFATAIPASGTYRQGDYLLNSVQTSGQPFGWVCTTTGTPGTWKIISTVS